VTRSLDPTGLGRARWKMQWKPALNAFAIILPTDSRPPKTTEMSATDAVNAIKARISAGVRRTAAIRASQLA
jgi:hypothetical protein